MQKTFSFVQLSGTPLAPVCFGCGKRTDGLTWSGSVQLRGMPRYYRLRTVIPRRPRNSPADCCPCRSQARIIPLLETVSRLFKGICYMEYEDTSSQEHEQKKLVIRRDKVVVTKVTEQELSQIKETASRCGMTRSDFIRARVLGYKPRQRLSDRELDGLRQLAACRTDMVNFANALHGLTDNEKLRLFRHEETMLEWYEKVAHVTNHVADFLQSTQTANSYPAGTTNQEAKEDGA